MEMEGRRRRRFGPNQADFLDYTMLLNMNLTRRTVSGKDLKSSVRSPVDL